MFGTFLPTNKCFLGLLFFFLNFVYVCACMSFLCTSCVQEPLEARRRRQIPWNWNNRQLWAALSIRVLCKEQPMAPSLSMSSGLSPHFPQLSIPFSPWQLKVYFVFVGCPFCHSYKQSHTLIFLGTSVLRILHAGQVLYPWAIHIVLWTSFYDAVFSVRLPVELLGLDNHI